LAQADTQRKVSGRKRLANAVLGGVGKVPEGVEETKGLENAGVDADADGRVALLDTLQRRARRKGALSHHSHRQAPAAAGIPNIGPELAQHATDARRREMWRRHNDLFMRLYLTFV
jgi:hypothetical protein